MASLMLREPQVSKDQKRTWPIQGMARSVLIAAATP